MKFRTILPKWLRGLFFPKKHTYTTVLKYYTDILSFFLFSKKYLYKNARVYENTIASF